MKTYRNLYAQLCSFENIYQAYRQARRGKRKFESVAAFEYNQEAELLRLRAELQAHTWQPGPYHSFYIHDPKRRLISAAPFRDRVAHHALCQIIEPIWEQRFIYDTYANRIGKGTHAALDRAQQFARRWPYVLQCDVKQFFPSIDHACLQRMLARHIADAGVLQMCDRIIDSGRGVLNEEYTMVWFPGARALPGARMAVPDHDGRAGARALPSARMAVPDHDGRAGARALPSARMAVPDHDGRAGARALPSARMAVPDHDGRAGDDLTAALRPRGLPLGNLTSQFWANVYLHDFDHFVKRELKCAAYVRYVDDFLLFSADKAQLHAWRAAVVEKLAEVRLTLHENRAQIYPVATGLPFLGFRLYLTHRLLKRRKALKFRRHFRGLVDRLARGEVELQQVTLAVRGWVNHARHGNTWGLRRAILGQVVVP